MIIAFLLTLLGLWNVPASEFPPPILQPKQYASPSGDFVLEVDPTQRLGKGAGVYRMSHKGAEAWSLTHPFTLWDARVRDDGWTVGYAYTAGWRDRRAEGELAVVSLSPQGEVVLKHSTERVPSRSMHTPPTPLALGLIFDASSDQFVVRVADPNTNRRIEQWWTYSIKETEREAVIRPAVHETPGDHSTQRIQDARWLPGLPLKLVWCWCINTGSRSMGFHEEGGTFALVDGEGKEIWSLHLPSDYTVRDDKQADEALAKRVRDHGALLEVGPAGRFSIWKVQDRTRIEFKVQRSPDGLAWEVATVQETEFDSQAANKVTDPLAPAVETMKLRPIQSVALGNASASIAEANRILEFDFTTDGHFRVLRRENEEQRIYRVEITDNRGAVVRETEFVPLPPELQRAAWWPLSSGRWLVTGTTYGDLVSNAFFASERSGELTPVPYPFDFSVESVSPLPEGGFVALVEFRQKYTSAKALYCFDDKGALLWKVTEDREKLFSLEDLAVTPAGRIAVLCSSRTRIQFLDLQGNDLKALELEAILPQEPNYPAGLTCDPSGALFLHDFDAELPLHRIDAQGVVTASLRIMPPDARPLGNMHQNAKVAPSGEIWTAEGSLLLRIARDGSIAETIGDLSHLEALTHPGPTRIDHLGRILIQDEMTGIVHAFNSAGQRLFTAHPDPGDFDDRYGAKIFVDASGSMYVQREYDEERLVHFFSEGQRVGMTDLGSRTVAFGRDGNRWLGFNSFDFAGVRRMRGEKTVAEVSRSPDRRWFGKVNAIALDAADNLAVSHSAGWRSRGSSGLSFYDSQGNPTGYAAVRGSQLALCDSWAAVWSRLPKVNLVRRSDNRVFEFLVDDAKEQETFHFGFSPDGKELWAIGTEGPVLRRLALP